MRKPLILAHRGASHQSPENTLEAFHMAFDDFGADMIELDIRLSKDGIPVVIHDADLERTTNGHGLVKDHLLVELQQFDAGYHFDPKGEGVYPFRGRGVKIPSLEEVLRAFPGKRILVELKENSDELMDKAVNLLKEFEALDLCVVGSLLTRANRVLSEKYPHVRRACSRFDVFLFLLNFWIGRKSRNRQNLRIASIPPSRYGISLMEPAWIEYLHSLGLQVYYWEVSDSKLVEKLVINGADGIILDDPGMLP